MVDRNILSLHDRIDEEHFEVHMLKSAVRALQEKVALLEARVRELSRDAVDRDDSGELRSDRSEKMSALRR
jgi:hypothetical protein